jgi:beta-glucosidase
MFAYKNLKMIPQAAGNRQRVTVSVDITNTGSRLGAEVVQLYVGDLHPKVPRPLKELKGFEKVWLNPGETRTATFELGDSAFAYYDVHNKRWTAAPGVYEILIGSSSRDIKAKGEFTLTK